MTNFHPTPRRRFAYAFAPVLIAGLAVSLVGCGAGDDREAPASTASNAAPGAGNGVTIKGDGLTIDGIASTAILQGYLSQPLSVRIMSGWVDKDKARRANQEADEAEKRKQAVASFGLLTLQVAAGTAAPGTYQLAAEEGGAQSGMVIIDKDEDAGLAGDYISQSGTLTIKSVVMSESSVIPKVTAVEGTFDGQFASDAGDSRAFSGNFRFVPKK